MKMFAWWFESRLAACPDAKTYTFARSGIAIPGIEPADVRSFSEKPDITVQKEKFLKRSEASEKGAPPDKEHFESAVSEFLREIASLRKSAEDGKRICENALAARDAERQTALRALADIDAAILKSSVKDAVSLALPSGKCFAELGENGDKTKDAFRETLVRSGLVYAELSRAASECEKYVPSVSTYQ